MMVAVLSNDWSWHKVPIAFIALTIAYISSADLLRSFFVDPFYARPN
jgi:hypothetical protein